MTEPAGAAWTCPFCPLVCDDLRLAPGLRLDGARCARAEHALAASAVVAEAPAWIDGEPADVPDALAQAAAWLAASRQPLVAGLGVDVAGARALYPLACASGAIVDGAGGDAFIEALRALQDRGQFTTTLAEVRTRADVVLFVGGDAAAHAPRLAERLGLAAAQPVRRVFTLAGAGGVLPDADPFDAVGGLGLALAPSASVFAALPPALRDLAATLRAARYAVFVGAPAALPRHGGLVVEAVHRIVHQLNRETRAAALWVGGGQGAATANQVWAWLGGLPLRTRAGPRGLEHEPHAFAAPRLLADAAADLLLWVSAVDPDARPPETAVPTIALAHPAQADAFRRPGCVFIGVGTPGIDHPGHLFRTDGTVLLPLAAARAAAAPAVDDVLRRLHAAYDAARRVGTPAGAAA